MNRSDLMRSLKSLLLVTIPKVLFLYALVPVLLLIFFAQPAGDAARGSGAAAWNILLASLGAVILNWIVYAAVHRKRPSLLVFAYGVFLLMITASVLYLALPGYNPLVSSLSIIGITLLQVVLILLSHWFVSLKTKPAYAAAVTVRVIVGIFLFIMAFEIIRQFENRLVNGYTWLTIGILAALLLGLFGSRILSSSRRARLRRRATGLTTGRIMKIVGETYLDPDDDQVTVFHAYIQYAVDGIPRKTHADITRFTLRRYGKESFIGREIPVRYDPSDPSRAYADRIRKPPAADDAGEKDAEDAAGQKETI